MSLMKVAPVVTQTVITPVKHINILSKLKVPALAATIMLGGAVFNKLHAQEKQRDVFVPNAISLKDTTNSVAKDSTINSDTTAFWGDSLINGKKNILGLNAIGSAASELHTRIISNISESGENPYSTLYSALNQMSNSNATLDVSSQLNDVLESMNEYNADQKEEIEAFMQQNGSISEFKYGPNNSKTGYIFQTLDITGINQKDDSDSTVADSTTATTTNNNLNDFIGNIAYRVKAVTEKAEVDANIHASNEDVDVQLAGMYKTKTTNDGNLALSVNGRGTIDGNKASFSAGSSLDYNKNDFSSGLYYYYNKETNEIGPLRNSELKGYLKYKQNVNLSAGIQDYDEAKYYYSELKLSGSTKLDNINLKLSGALSAELGSCHYDLRSFGLDDVNLTNFDLSAMGGVYFKTDDIMASLNGRVSYNYLMNSANSEDNSNNLGLSVLGAFSRNNISVSAMFSMFKDLLSAVNSETGTTKSDNMNIAASVGFEIKDLLNGISPQFSYTSVSIGNQIRHFFNVTLKTSLEALKKSQH